MLPNPSEYVDAQPCNLSKSVIEKFASDFARNIGVRVGAPLEPVIERLGGVILYISNSEFDRTGGASIFVKSLGSFTIFLPDYTSPLRDRFSIAHELGHLALHYPLLRKPMKAARYGSNRAEWEANWFAAGFLMPEAEFRREFENRDHDIAEVATKFVVSEQAAEVRARSLALAS